MTSLLEREARFYWCASRNLRALREAGVDLTAQEESADDLDALAFMTGSDRLRGMARAAVAEGAASEAIRRG